MFSNVNIADVKIRFGTLVKTLRKKQGLTQEQLGNKLNLSRITIQNLESGKNATMDTMLIVMQYLDLLANFNDMLQTEITNSSYPSLY
jgi:transcriptional regulator with XRE-family HTH domain